MTDPDALRVAASAAIDRGHVLTGDLLNSAADDLESLHGFIERQFPGFDVETAMMMFDKKRNPPNDHNNPRG